jgi:hypothetical protein
VDLTLSPQLEAFAEEVRRFIRDRAPDVPPRNGVRAPESEEELALVRRWTRDLFEAGYVNGDWPADYHGRPGHDPLEDVVLSREMAAADAPLPLGAGTLAGNAILQFGSDEQRRSLLPRIVSAEDIWCQLFSEPDAGSDLASLRTRAVHDGDRYVVTGQKVWSTNAQWADYGYLLARTDPDAPKHAGITAFALDMRLPGIEVRPLREITGTSDFNEVFLDEVSVPTGAVIGRPNQGWTVATASLVQERLGVAGAGIRLQQTIHDLIALAQRCTHDGAAAAGRADVRQRLADLYARVQISRCLGYVAVTHQLRGEVVLSDAPVGKLFFSELNLEIAECALALQQMDSLLAEREPTAVDGGTWQDAFLYARAYTIAGGSSEIMRNMLAERALGMPKEPKPTSA